MHAVQRAALLATSIPESVWRQTLAEPMECERRMLTDPTFKHNHEVVYLIPGKLSVRGKRQRRKPTYDTIGQVMFVWENSDRGDWADALWMCIGKTNDGPFYFAFCSDRGGTGFGCCETSTMYLSKSLDELFMRALTDTERAIVCAATDKTR